MKSKIIKEKSNNLRQAIMAVLFIEVIFLLIIGIGLKSQNIDLNDNSIIEIMDRVESYGEEIRNDGSIRRTPVVARKSFFIKLASKEKKIGVYRANGNYEDLYSLCRENDTLRIHFKPNDNRRESINISIIQIENRDGLVLLGKNEFEGKMSSLIWIGLFGMIVLPVLVFLQYKRQSKREKVLTRSRKK